MKNQIASGNVLDYVVPVSTTIVSGQAVLIGDVLGIAVTDGAEGDTIAVNVEGVYSIPKVAGEMLQGTVVYWNHTQSKVTLTTTGFKPVGYIYRTAASAATEAEVVLTKFARTAVSLTQLEQGGATDGQVIKWNNTDGEWEPGADA